MVAPIRNINSDFFIRVAFGLKCNELKSGLLKVLDVLCVESIKIGDLGSVIKKSQILRLISGLNLIRYVFTHPPFPFHGSLFSINFSGSHNCSIIDGVDEQKGIFQDG